MNIQFEVKSAADVVFAIKALAYMGLGYDEVFPTLAVLNAAEGITDETPARHAASPSQIDPPEVQVLLAEAGAKARAEKETGFRRTKAEVAADLLTELQAAKEPTPPAEDAPSDTQFDMPSKDELLARARKRAKEVGGREWLVEHVLCNNRYENLSAVPDALLFKALAL